MNSLVQWMRNRNRVLIMGIVNVTPDSFYNGGRLTTAETAVDTAVHMVSDGADIIDVGGESTRPGSSPISTEEEIDRVLPVIQGIRRRSDVVLSIDTMKSHVAQEALSAGAQIVNDVSALRGDEAMAKTIADADAYVILMHMLGTPDSMQDNPTYEDVVEDVTTFLLDRCRAAAAAGIPPDRVLVDPGIGFGKRLEHNLALLRGLGRLSHLGRPVVVGLSRKSFLGRILDLPANERLEGTIAANAISVVNGADVLRVHDVLEGRRTADVAFRLRHDAS